VNTSENQSVYIELWALLLVTAMLPIPLQLRTGIQEVSCALRERLNVNTERKEDEQDGTMTLTTRRVISYLGFPGRRWNPPTHSLLLPRFLGKCPLC
jgi:hypothetical protein